jgi:hypothetical protein
MRKLIKVLDGEKKDFKLNNKDYEISFKESKITLKI